MQPKVSIVVPCYNKEPYVGNMIQSVYNQQWDNIEVIFVDDGSTDKTADIVKQWIPRLKKRGYEAVLIHQKNQGVAAAVLCGMLRMTGEFFCQADCDDMLHPEYVSAMASRLRDNPGYDWVSCDHETFHMDDANKPPVRQAFPDLPTSGHMTESFLLLRMCLSVWIYMVRVEYIRRCRLMDIFSVEPSVSQEPQIIIPLATGGGKLMCLPAVLYRYNLSSIGFERVATLSKARKYHLAYSALSRSTINRLDIDEGRRERLLAIAELAHVKWLHLDTISLYKNDGWRRMRIAKTVNLIKQMLDPAPNVSLETVIHAGMPTFFRAVENCVLKLDNKFLASGQDLKATGRVIGYGALSWLARDLTRALYDTPMRPDLLWDKSASAESPQNGMAVVKPNMSELSPEDTVLIFSNNLYVADEIAAIVKRRGVAKILGYFDILEYLAAYYFPEIQKSCGFTG